MKKTYAPSEWAHMHPGDQIHSGADLAQLKRFAEQLGGGYRFRFERKPQGYWIICEESPRPLRPWEQHE